MFNIVLRQRANKALRQKIPNGQIKNAKPTYIDLLRVLDLCNVIT
jgi:hypothetical protein